LDPPATAPILADFEGIAAFNGIFMIEEQTREKPMRRIDAINHGYDGPAPRSVPK
jgi:hypothetical protein